MRSARFRVMSLSRFSIQRRIARRFPTRHSNSSLSSAHDGKNVLLSGQYRSASIATSFGYSRSRRPYSSSINSALSGFRCFVTVDSRTNSESAVASGHGLNATVNDDSAVCKSALVVPTTMSHPIAHPISTPFRTIGRSGSEAAKARSRGRYPTSASLDVSAGDSPPEVVLESPVPVGFAALGAGDSGPEKLEALGKPFGFEEAVTLSLASANSFGTRLPIGWDSRSSGSLSLISGLHGFCPLWGGYGGFFLL